MYCGLLLVEEMETKKKYLVYINSPNVISTDNTYCISRGKNYSNLGRRPILTVCRL